MIRDHWTPQYVYARCRELANQKRHPDDPWLTREAVLILGRLIRPSDHVVEFGSGRSTIWFARRVRQLHSVEHDQAWHDRVNAQLATLKFSNVDLRYRKLDKPEPEGADSQYVKVLDEFDDNSIDIILVDGEYRGHCALRALKKLRNGGILVVDNVNWFLPSTSKSPNARNLEQGPRDMAWRDFEERTKDWRRLWTSSGVTDTAFFFKSQATGGSLATPGNATKPGAVSAEAPK